MNPKEIILDDISNAIKMTYDVYNWKGRLTEGLPIGLIEEDGDVKFNLNTNTLKFDTIFAIATRPNYFQNLSSSQLLKDAPLPSEISNFKVDGTSITNGAATLTAGEHVIEFTVNLTSSKSAVPLFFKIEYPNTNTSKLREPLILPKEYMFTTA